MGTHRARLPPGGRLNTRTDLLTADLEAKVRGLASSAKRELRIVAPFIKAARLQVILDSVASGVAVIVTTRWRAAEVAAGVSDLEVFDVCRKAGATLRLMDRLHAKLYLADGSAALVGSANVTGMGLGCSTSPNFEILVAVEPSARSLIMTLGAMDADSRPATDAERDAVAAAALEVPAAPPIPADAASSDAKPLWLPRFRSPDRLQAVYGRMGKGGRDEGVDEAALSDIVNLRLPADLTPPDFAHAVRTRLRASAMAAALDPLLEVPRRFGEVSRWVGELRPETSRSERQRLAQTLIRWLVQFDGGRYRLDTPNYSEILSLTPTSSDEQSGS